MTILQVLGGFAVGGTETFVISLVQGLIERGHDASLLITTGGCPIGAAAAAAGVPFEHLDGGPPKLTLRWFRVVHRNLRARRFDLVHSYGLRVSLGIRLMQRRLGIAHHLTGVRGLDVRRTGLQVWLDRRTEHRLDAIVCNADAVARRRMSVVGTPAKRIRVIPNGIDTARFRPTPDGDRPSRESLHLPDGFLFVTVGNFRPEKDHDTLLQAVRISADRLANAKLVLIGDGALRPGVEEHARRIGVADRLIFLGAVDDVRPYLSTCDAFVLSSHSEGSPRALLEAMAMGVPAVSTTAGGVPELAENQRHALLVPTRSPESLAAAMVRISQDPALRKRLGAAAAQRVRDRFSRHAMLDQHIDLYESILRGHPQ